MSLTVKENKYYRGDKLQSIENALLLAGIVTLIVGTVCRLWINYRLGVKIFDVGCIYILACWAFEFAVKVIDRWN